jgi:predicted component of type VI protein secretion system
MDLGAADGDERVSANGSETRPTHVLFEGRAYRLDSRAFNIGSELAPGDYGATLDGKVSGVSRRHCSIRVSRHGVEVLDHSRYGTSLNGHTVDGAAILQSGDVVSLGIPKCEFLLITEVTPESADPA